MIDTAVLDCDGVLIDMVGGIFDYFGWEYPTHLTDHTQREYQTDYYLYKLMGVEDETIWAPLGRDFWASLKPLPWAEDVVSMLEKRFGAEKICLLTRPVATPGCVQGKLDWIEQHLPDYIWRNLVGSAKQFCSSPRRILIDDHEENCKDFREAGGHTFLFPAPWNRRYKEDAGKAVEEWIRAMEVLDKSRL